MADQVMAYCVKEKAQKPMNNPQQVTLKNGKLALQGVCSSCGTKMMKFISSKKASPTVGGTPVAPTGSGTPPPPPSPTTF